MSAFLSDLGHLWLWNIVGDMRRYVMFAVSVWFVLWILLAAILRGRKIREATPAGGQLAQEFLFSARSIAIFSTVGVIETLATRAGFYPLPAIGQTWGPAWFWASLVIMIVAHDAYFYWTHRLMHDPRWFRRLHRRHHRSNNPSPFTAYSFDVGEALLMVAFMVVWPLITPTPWGVTGLFMLHQIFRNTLLHCGYELMPMRRDGRPWLDFLTTTTHHDLHHAQAGHNYAAWFTWWDRWMGTEHPQYLARYAEAARRRYITLPKLQPAA
jgi:sterol desaturase/sphingolipid hydroxylase (fatty acid hydroxylase superfamily)